MAVRKRQKARKSGKTLSPEDVRKIIRGIMIQKPNYDRYGYNQAVIKLFKENYNYDLDSEMVNYYKKQVIEDWNIEEENRWTKKKMVQVLENEFSQDGLKVHDKMEIVDRISEIEGIASPKPGTESNPLAVEILRIENDGGK